MNINFGIIGGDKRQIYLAKSILEDGYNVFVNGFELSSQGKGLKEVPLSVLMENCDKIILPLPVTRDGETIFAPYSSEPINVDDEFVLSLIGKNVYGGLMNKIVLNNHLWAMTTYDDYYKREELAISNAIPTAEGAVAIAINEHSGVLNGSSCLVTGYGRIGKCLGKILNAMGAKVSISARKAKDLAMIRAMGCKPVRYGEITESYDIIFNTVPEIVITNTILKKQKPSTIIIELASPPGGISRKDAISQGVKIIDGQSLPGKVSPKASGEYIKEAIYNMLEE